MPERDNPDQEWWTKADLPPYSERNGSDHDLFTLPEPSPVRHEQPIRDLLKRIWAPIAAAVGIALKLGVASFKFLSIFIAVGGYALIWGWQFGAGIVLLILVHEMGHYAEARRQGLHPNWPVFIPFLGAYVAIKDAKLDPFHNSLVALAGPVVGGIGAAVSLALAPGADSDLLRALAYTGFFLNLANLIPIGILDGGAIYRGIRGMRAARDPRWWWITLAYVGTAALLVYGMVVAHIPQDRL